MKAIGYMISSATWVVTNDRRHWHAEIFFTPNVTKTVGGWVFAPGQIRSDHCGRSQRSARPFRLVEGDVFQCFLATKSLIINQISVFENVPKLTYEHLQMCQNVSGGYTRGSPLRGRVAGIREGRELGMGWERRGREEGYRVTVFAVRCFATAGPS